MRPYNAVRLVYFVLIFCLSSGLILLVSLKAGDFSVCLPSAGWLLGLTALSYFMTRH